MRNLVEQIKQLSELKADSEGSLTDEAEADLVNHERNIEELELRLELVGVDMEELRGRLSGHLEEEHGSDNEGTIQDAATLKVVGDMVAPVARTLVLELMGTLTNSELQRRGLEKEVETKDAKLKDLEMKNADLKTKISQIAEASQFGSVHGVEGAFEIKSQLDEKERRLSETKEKLTKAELKFQSAGIELAECKEKLSVVDVSKDMKKETASTLAQLQTYWRLLGIDLEEREKVRNELEGCVEEKCNALLRDATKRERETRQEIDRLNEMNESMQRALGRVSNNTSSTSSSSFQAHFGISTSTENRLSLLKQRELAQQTYTEIEPIFRKAKARHAKILKDAKALLGALEKGENSISRTLRGFLGAQADKDGLFAEDLLTSCEDELRKMRVMKSELLVKSNSAYERANKLATETHSSSSDLFLLAKSFVSKDKGKSGAADWWTETVCKQVCDFITISNMKVPTSSVWGKHLEIITRSVEAIAEGREEFSNELKVVVEEAHKQLMGIVEGDEDATEAYASFHSALFRLPRLSKDHIKACVNEIKILVGAADVMMQSETEALTVVWDALGLNEETRGCFWGECAESVRKYQDGKESGPFDNISLVGSNTENVAEEWLAGLLKDAKSFQRELRAKLYRLQLIHTEVEKKRTKQDAKSAIMSLDSEIRIIDAKLTQFEDKAGSKQRLVSKKTNSGILLKEEKFRKHMQAKFISKLEKLRATLRGWEARESTSFDVGLLSEEVRGLLGTGLGGAEDRTAFMHLRTVKSSAGIGVGGSKRRSTILGGGSKDSGFPKEKDFSGGGDVKLKRSNSDGNLRNKSNEQGGDNTEPTQLVNKDSIATAIAEASAGVEALTSTNQMRNSRRKSRAASLAAYKSKKKETQLSQMKEVALRDGKDNKGETGNGIGEKRKTKSSTRGRQSANPFGNVLTPTKENEQPSE
ncbi:hypothetical protein TrCOL_g1706 [Triparma columacea]|uniref:Uncharacterized protein n=2 Tax=Triparma columacea TaxID=722753 RepID=A0A9W7GLX5_9STRA|nr:hypothetical protein TrCOL_g1706 [Triparma columacea]